MTSPDSQPPGQTTVERLVEQFSTLLETLQAERAALVDRSPDALQEVVSRKQTLCDDIARDQQHLLAELDSGGSRPPAGIGELREIARRCQSENALNGRIVNRARHTARTLLGVLTGEPPADLYHPSGQEVPAAARPTTGHHLGSA